MRATLYEKKLRQIAAQDRGCFKQIVSAPKVSVVKAATDDIAQAVGETTRTTSDCGRISAISLSPSCLPVLFFRAPQFPEKYWVDCHFCFKGSTFPSSWSKL
jgi:hypothetical protein